MSWIRVWWFCGDCERLQEGFQLGCCFYITLVTNRNVKYDKNLRKKKTISLDSVEWINDESMFEILWASWEGFQDYGRIIDTWDSTVGAGVIVWITTAIVIGTILILVSAGCVVHHIRLKYLHKTRQARERMLLEQNKDDQKDQETVPLASDKDRKKQSSESIDTSMMKEEIKKNDEPIEQPLLTRKATETGV